MGDRDMIMRAEAVGVLARVVISCDPIIKAKKKHVNEKFVMECFSENKDILFVDFKNGLIEGHEREDKIGQFVAEDLGRDEIGPEDVEKYFGSHSHIQMAVDELKDLGFDSKHPFFNIAVVMHTMIPLSVTEIDKDRFAGIYRIGEYSFPIKNLTFLKKDFGGLGIGKTVLVHYPLLIDTEPSEAMLGWLNDVHVNNPFFMDACRFFSGKELDYGKIPMYIRHIKGILNKYDL